MNEQLSPRPDAVQAVDEVLVGIPAYNEEQTVGNVVTKARKYATMVLVVDDGSDDRTAQVARAAGADVIEHEENRGYGATLQTLFRAASELDVEHLAILDADGQHDPADVPTLVSTQRSSGAEVVIGSRFAGESENEAPLYRRFGLAVINRIVGLALLVGYSQSGIRDTQSGFRVYDREVIDLLAEDASLNDGMDASVDILFRASEASCSFVEVPVTVSYDVAKANTHNPIVHGSVILRNVLAKVVFARPYRSLTAIGGTILLGATFLFSANSRMPAVDIVSLALTAVLIVGGASLAAAASLAVENFLARE